MTREEACKSSPSVALDKHTDSTSLSQSLDDERIPLDWHANWTQMEQPCKLSYEVKFAKELTQGKRASSRGHTQLFVRGDVVPAGIIRARSPYATELLNTHLTTMGIP